MLGTDPSMTLYNHLCCAVGRKKPMEKCICIHIVFPFHVTNVIQDGHANYTGASSYSHSSIEFEPTSISYGSETLFELALLLMLLLHAWILQLLQQTGPKFLKMDCSSNFCFRYLSITDFNLNQNCTSVTNYLGVNHMMNHLFSDLLYYFQVPPIFLEKWERAIFHDM